MTSFIPYMKEFAYAQKSPASAMQLQGPPSPQRMGGKSKYGGPFSGTGRMISRLLDGDSVSKVANDLKVKVRPNTVIDWRNRFAAE